MQAASTQTQRPAPREAWIANPDAKPGSFQRMVNAMNYWIKYEAYALRTRKLLIAITAERALISTKRHPPDIGAGKMAMLKIPKEINGSGKTDHRIKCEPMWSSRSWRAAVTTTAATPAITLALTLLDSDTLIFKSPNQ